MQYFTKVLWPILLIALFVSFVGFICTLGIRPIMIGTDYSPSTKVEVMSRNEFIMFSGDAGMLGAIIVGVVLLFLVVVIRGIANRNQ